jgi:hypothetical protein
MSHQHHKEHPAARRARLARQGVPVPLVSNDKKGHREKRARDARAKDRRNSDAQ